MGPCRLLKSREPRLCVSWRREKSEYYIDGLVVSSEATPHAARWLQTWMRRVFFACACACAPQTLNGTKAPEKPPKPPEGPPDSPNRKPTQYILFFFFGRIFRRGGGDLQNGLAMQLAALFLCGPALRFIVSRVRAQMAKNKRPRRFPK